MTADQLNRPPACSARRWGDSAADTLHYPRRGLNHGADRSAFRGSLMEGPSAKWGELFRQWRYATPPSWMTDTAEADEERELLASAGALCDAVITGQICCTLVPEAQRLRAVARGLASPETPLQHAVLNCVQRRFDKTRERLSQATAQASAARTSFDAIETRLTQNAAAFVLPPSLSARLADAHRVHDECEKSLTLSRANSNTLRRRLESDLDPAVIVARAKARVLATRRDAIAATLQHTADRLNEATQILIRRRAQNLLRPEDNRDAAPDPERISEQTTLRYKVSELEALLAGIEIKLAQAEHDVEQAADEQDRVRREIHLMERNHQRALAEASEQIEEARRAITLAEHRAVETRDGELADCRRELIAAERHADKLVNHTRATTHLAENSDGVGQAYLDLMISCQAQRAAQAFFARFPSWMHDAHRTSCGWSVIASHFIHECIKNRFPEVLQDDPADKGTFMYEWMMSTDACSDEQRRALEVYIEHLLKSLQIECTLDSCAALAWYSDPPTEPTGHWQRTTQGENLNRAKYHMDETARDRLVHALSQAVDGDPILRSASAVCAVPALPSKLFDLPRELASTLATHRGIANISSAIIKSHETARPMKDIDDIHEKIANVLGVFEAVSGSIAGERILLIDDTIGSGVTLWAAAKSLYSAGAARVFGLTCCKNRGSR